MRRIKKTIQRITKVFATYKEYSSKEYACKKRIRKKSRMAIWLDMLYCYIKYGAPPDDYYAFGFSDKSALQRNTYFTKQMYKKLLKRNNNAQYNIIPTDKFICSKVYSEGFNRQCIAKNKFLTFESFEAFASAAKKFIYKPSASSCGKGIEVFTATDIKDTKELYNYIFDLPDGVLEEWIKQHPQMAEVYPDAVSCIRIATVLDKETCVFLSSFFSVSHNTDIANAGNGALFALVDVSTGELTSPLCSKATCETYRFHPKTEFDMQGFRIPFWDEVLACVTRASKVVPQLGFVSWDIALSETGPVIIETNRGNYQTYQYFLLGDDEGKKAIWEKYI